MKKPKSVVIQGHTYEIISDNSTECKDELESDSLRGCIKFALQKIYISPDQHDESWNLTLIHEIIHGFLNHFGIKDNERLVSNLTTAIFTFIKENRQLLKGLK